MTDTQDRIAGQTILVTGASSGIGAATTKALLDRGAHVVAVARSVGQLESLEASEKDRLVVERADVRDREQIEGVVERTVYRSGGLAAIVCNAGVGEYAGFLDMAPETIVEIVETNLLGTVWPIRAALPHMLAAGHGDVIVVSSVVAGMDSAGEAVYAATKAGQRSLAGCLDLEVKERGVRVSTILPGGVRTQFAMGRGRTPDMPDLDTMLDPADVAGAILTLLSQPPHMRTTAWGFSHLAEE
jgi:NADP-dependent 3-hydroxy acid dehydrogenase YdfG